MLLTDLPVEILSYFAEHLHDIEDFTHFSSTCRTLRAALSKPAPHTILQLAARSAPTFFSPHPWYLIAATARSAARTALGNESLTKNLVEAFQGGIDSLYEFCLEHSGITLEDIRKWHLARFSTINPFSDHVDKIAGQQWYETPDFWNGGVSEACTLATDADRCTYQIIIYGELFQDSMRSFLEPQLGLPAFKPEVRIGYVKYCVPDWACARSYLGTEVQHDRGPYTKINLEACPGDQQVLHHVLACGRWTRMWQNLLRQIAQDFDDTVPESYEEHGVTASSVSETRQALWWGAAVECGGVQGLSAVTTTSEDGTVTAETRSRLVQTRNRIEALDEAYLRQLDMKTRSFGKFAKTMIAAYPDLKREVRHCLRSYWNDPRTTGPEDSIENVQEDNDIDTTEDHDDNELPQLAVS